MFWVGTAALSFPSQVLGGFDEHLQELMEWFFNRFSHNDWIIIITELNLLDKLSCFAFEPEMFKLQLA